MTSVSARAIAITNIRTSSSGSSNSAPCLSAYCSSVDEFARGPGAYVSVVALIRSCYEMFIKVDENAAWAWRWQVFTDGGYRTWERSALVEWSNNSAVPSVLRAKWRVATMLLQLIMMLMIMMTERGSADQLPTCQPVRCYSKGTVETIECGSIRG